MLWLGDGLRTALVRAVPLQYKTGRDHDSGCNLDGYVGFRLPDRFIQCHCFVCRRSCSRFVALHFRTQKPEKLNPLTKQNKILSKSQHILNLFRFKMYYSIKC